MLRWGIRSSLIMKGKPVADEVARRENTAITAALSPEVAIMFAQMVTAIPEYDGNANDDILMSVLTADSWEDLNRAWETAKGEQLAGHMLRIDAITRHESDMAEGLGFFLVAKGVDTRTGESFTWPTGSYGVMGQLVRAHLQGWLPLFGEVIIAARPTKQGFRPQHINFTGRAGTDAPRPDRRPPRPAPPAGDRSDQSYTEAETTAARKATPAPPGRETPDEPQF